MSAWTDRISGAQERWNAASLRTRLMVLGGVSALVGVAVWAVAQNRGSDMAVLFSELSQNDSARVQEQLAGMQVPFEPTDGGSTILVPEDRVHESRMSLAASGLPSQSGVGFEVFDEQRFGESEFSEQVKYHRALEGELSRTIAHLSGVERARVHLVLPSRSLFADREVNASASVALHMRPGFRLNDDQVRGIGHLVASSVRGLEPGDVTIVDGQGRSVGGEQSDGKAATDSLSYRREIEKAKQRSVQQLLDDTLGAGVAAVRVAADVSFTREERTEERYLPDEVAPRSFQISEERDTNARNATEGVPGAASNLPGGEQPDQTSSTEGLVRRNETRNFEVSKTVKHQVEPVGRVERLTIAVVVDGLWKGEGESRTFKPRPDDELKRIEEIVASAAGINEERGDRVTVKCVPFAATADPAGAFDPNDPLAAYRPYFPLAAGGFALLLLLVGGLLFLRAKKKKKKQEEAAKLEELKASAAPLGLPGDVSAAAQQRLASVELGALGSGESADELRNRLSEGDALAQGAEEIQMLAAELAAEDPSRAARVVRGWLIEGNIDAEHSEQEPS